MKRRISLILITLLASLPWLVAMVQAEKAPLLTIPLPGATLVQPNTTIAIRQSELVDTRSVRNDLFAVDGSRSGSHSGRAVLSDDHHTVIFKPDLPFALGEQVTVTLKPGLQAADQHVLDGVTFNFSIKPRSNFLSPAQSRVLMTAELGTSAAPAAAAAQVVTNLLTLPANLPVYTITVPTNGAANGSLFLAPFSLLSGLRPALLLLNHNGELVYYRQLTAGTFVMDFKRQPDGTLTYFDGALGRFEALNQSYEPVNTYEAGNGYLTDLHDLQVLPNGHSLLLGLDNQSMDMSQIVAGGSPTATVIGAIVQELDIAHNVVFEWRSWDHFLLTDTTESLTGTLIDPVHPNAVELDQDGNLLLSSRHMDEITKIDRQTGATLWRLGGKNNQFTFVDDPRGFTHQHDIRRLPDGNVTLFDNHNGGSPPYSRGVEYALDETHKVITQVWEVRNTPDVDGFALGNLQRLPNGNSLIGWGASITPVLSEFKPSGAEALEISLQSGYLNYRAFRFAWHGYPSAAPTLVAQSSGVTTTLAYSWNGATEIASYKVYGGDAPYPSDLIATQARTGFEDHTILVNEHRYCYFRVMPVNKQGNDTQYSNEVYTRQGCTSSRLFLPSIMR